MSAEKQSKKQKKEKNLVEYKLMHTNNNLDWQEISDEQVNMMKGNYPEIFQLLMNPKLFIEIPDL